MKYLALDKKTYRAFDPDVCDHHWVIVPMPPLDVLREGGYGGRWEPMEHVLYRDRDHETGRVHWIDYKFHNIPEREEHGLDAGFEVIEEITEEQAHALLASIGAEPPDADLPPIICSQSELASRMGYKPNYSNFARAMEKQGKLRSEPIDKHTRRFWLTDKHEHIRIFKEIEGEKNAGAQPSPHGDPT
jgi:hypothetical protein